MCCEDKQLIISLVQVQPILSVHVIQIFKNHCHCEMIKYKVRLKRSETAPIKSKTVIYLNFLIIPFKVETLCSDILLSALLPRLERSLEVQFFKCIQHHLRGVLDLLHCVKTASLQLELNLLLCTKALIQLNSIQLFLSTVCVALSVVS